MATVTLNGVTLTPTTIETGIRKEGERLVMANGSVRFFHRAHKRTWTLSWNLAGLTALLSVISIFTTTSTMTYVDENGSSYTVIPTDDFGIEFGAEQISLTGFKYYSFSLTIEEV